MTTDLRDKLRQLGVTKGATHVKPPARPQERRERSIESLLHGQQVESPLGRTFVVEKRYAPDYVHGAMPLDLLLDQSVTIAAQLAREPALAGVDLHRAVFLDTETTGLAGGAGTFAFLVGIGSFERAQGTPDASPTFCIRQFFLRDPDEEAAMLATLAERMDVGQAIVTFNGRGFDLPLLQARYILARLRPTWLALPHLDLLMPARRVWRERLPSCALSSLEMHVLGVQREQADVPGYLIPQMYLDYLQSGDASEMLRVMYHNQQDILSMVTLAARLCRMFGDPLTEESLDPADLVSLGKWYDDLEMHALAERAFRVALEREIHSTTRAVALARLGLLMKRQHRREEAVAAWEQLARVDDSNVLAYVELAKHFEWHAGDLGQALTWTLAAREVVTGWPASYARDQASAELEHRLQRLERKQRTKRVE
jgi:uncharacterized protein YprB with RNaseH-like and TPR domain